MSGASMEFQGKAALVTGASRGIGRAISLRLARDGAAVVVNYLRDDEAAAETVRLIEAAGGRAEAQRGDVSNPASAAAIAQVAHTAFGRIDILVNNAGVIGMTPLEATTVDEYDRIFAANTRGLFFLTQMVASLLADGGRIVSLSSIVSRMRYPGSSVYAASKAAVEAFTRSWSAELGTRGITVNSISPGMVETDMMHSTTTPEMRAGYGAQGPMGRIGRADDVAQAVAFLCSAGASWITGQDVSVNGGAG